MQNRREFQDDNDAYKAQMNQTRAINVEFLISLREPPEQKTALQMGGLLMNNHNMVTVVVVKVQVQAKKAKEEVEIKKIVIMIIFVLLHQEIIITE